MSITDALKPATPGAPHVAAHAFGAGVQLWARGDISKATFMAQASIPANAGADLDTMAAVYNAKASAVAKLEYVVLAMNCALALESGLMTATQFRTVMELS